MSGRLGAAGGAAMVGRLVRGLHDAGVTTGTRVAALLDEHGPAVALIHALAHLGAVHVPLDRRAAVAELAVRLELVTPAAILHDASHALSAEELARSAGCPALSIESMLDGEPAERLAGPRPRAGTAPVTAAPTAPATIVFTSGTAGRPRAAVLSHANHRASAEAWAAVIAPRPSDAWLLSLPLHHVAGLAIVMRAHHWGTALRIPTSQSVETLAAHLEAGVSHLSLVPTQLGDLLATWGDRPAPRTLRAILLGGAPIATSLLTQARALGFPVLTTYGMTETASGIAVGGEDGAEAAGADAAVAAATAGGEEEPGAAGWRADHSGLRPLPGVRLRIAEVTLAADDGGEIEIAGAMVFGGYLGDEEATAGRLRDGWLRTGDLGRIDADGLLHVIGRRDEVIISGGENIHPAEVEAVLRSIPGVVDAAVIGRPDARWGSVPVAAVVAADGSDVSGDAMRRRCRERLAAYKVPHRIHLVAALPHNAVGKVVRSEVAALLADDRDAPQDGAGQDGAPDRAGTA